MFRIVCDPSSGSIELYLTEIIGSDSLMFVGVWQRNFEPAVCVCVCVCVCVYGTTGWELLVQKLRWFKNYADKHQWTTTSNFSQARSTLPDDGSHMIRNMSEWFLILCLLKFLYNVDFNF
jgi:hypothetical protein